MLSTGPQLMGIQPDQDAILQDGDTRNTAPHALTFRFDGAQVIDASTLDAIQITRAGGDQHFGDANDIAITPGFKGLADAPNEVLLRFAETLPDDLYWIDVIGTGDLPLRNTLGARFNSGQDFQSSFRLDLGAQVVAVVPQPITRAAGGTLSQARDQIVVYFNDDDLNPADAQSRSLYQLISTGETANNADDQVFYPTGVTYDASADMAVLTFGADLEDLAGEGTLRLRIGTDESIPMTPLALSPSTDVGSAFATSTDLGSLEVGSQVISSAIDAMLFELDYPGGNDEPGHREIPNEVAGGFGNHINPDFGADHTDGIITISYNFKRDYGVDPAGQPLVNLITARQKQLARDALTMWGNYIGVQFQETANQGLTIVTGDPQALDPDAPDVVNHASNKPLSDLNFIAKVDPAYQDSMLILDNAQQWNDNYGGDWMKTAMTGIGFMLGLDRATDLPASNLMAFGSDVTFPGATASEPIFPGNEDILHGSFVHRPDSNDIDLYRFDVAAVGEFTAETFSERQLPDASLLDTYLTLYRENGDGTRAVIARNDDYYSHDSYIELRLEPGVYYIGVTASGNDAYNPEFEDTGSGGKTQGMYDLRVNFRPEVVGTGVLHDTTGTALDGDADGVPGGVYNFWFRAVDETHTVIVDKASTSPQLGAKGTFDNIPAALAVAAPGDVVRVVGNGGSDSNMATLRDNYAYEIGLGTLPGQILADGTTLDVPRQVALMIDSGAILKLRKARIGVGSSSLGVNRQGGALQVLGTPTMPVYFTSYLDESLGLDTFAPTTTPKPGDWGGLVYRNDLDNAEGRANAADAGIFIDYVNHADIRFGGGNVVVDSVKQIVTPIQILESRPSISFNQISTSADAPISADPDSFEETNFHAPEFQQGGLFTADYERVGPDIHSNRLVENSTNGLFVRITTPAGNAQKKLTVAGRFDDTDVVHIIAENLKIQGTPGGPIVDATGTVVARPDARLAIDPGTIVKLEGSRIETEVGGQLIAEGLKGREIIFTARSDDRYGAGGTFDTNGDGSSVIPAAGDWGGLFAGPASAVSIDYALLTFGGGTTKIEGTFKAFNILEIHQADVRLAHSVLEQNGTGVGGQGPDDRFGRGFNEAATIYVRGAQPVLLDNLIRDNAARAITINANSFTPDLIDDPGRSTGMVGVAGAFPENQGPLIRGNRLWNNPLNGIDIRGEVLTTMSVWDDTDVVHVLRGEQIIVPDNHSNVGLRLESNPGNSLVVKLDGPGDNFDPAIGAGFTATGRQLGIDDHIGGTLHVVGQPDFPVVLTSLRDDTVGAGLAPDGNTLTDTNNDGQATLPAAGDWRSIRFEEMANDRNVELILESEARDAKSPGENAVPSKAQFLGNLAAAEQSSDDNLRLGFEIHGVLNEPTDIDVYSLNAVAGTEVWFDIDRTTSTLNSVVELIDADGNVVARSDDSLAETIDPTLLYHDPAAIEGYAVNPLQKANDTVQPRNASGQPKDFFSLNTLDAGMRVVLPGVVGTTSTYHVRVRSSSNDLSGANLHGGLTTGAYQLQIRLRETDEVPGVTARYADIRYATNGVEAYGLPSHSPLVGEAGEDEVAGGPETNDRIAWGGTPAAGPQDLGNLLGTDRGAISVAGFLSDRSDIDIFEFQVKYEATGAQSTAHVSTVFDVDYADGLARPDTNLIIFDATGRPILIGSDSNIAEDRPRPLTSNGDMVDLSRGSVGTNDPYIGPVSLPEGTYFAAVMSDDWTTEQLLSNPEVSLQPINSVTRTADDPIMLVGDPDRLFDWVWVRAQSNRGRWDVLPFAPGTGKDPAAEAYDDSLGNMPWVQESEPNDLIATAQDLERELWTLGYNTDIENADSWAHVSIVGATGDTTRDYYSFEVPAAGTDAVFDIDIDWDEILDPHGRVLGDTRGDMDANLRLWSETGQLLATADDGPIPFDGGSVPKADFNLNPVNTDPMIQYTFAAPGRYMIEVTRTIPPFLYQPPQEGDLYTLHVSVNGHPSGGTPVGANFGLVYTDFDTIRFPDSDITNATNTQPIMIETTPQDPNRALFCVADGTSITVSNVNGNTNANGTHNALFVAPGRFLLDGVNGNGNYRPPNPAANPPEPPDFWTYSGTVIQPGSYGSVLSTVFDLTGYSADDQPTLYFDYKLDIAPTPEHQFNVYIVQNGERLNDGNPIATKGAVLQNIDEWRQARLDLSSVVGQKDLQLEFEFDGSTSLCEWVGTDGVSVDNIIIGFAERGEMILRADSDPTFSPDPLAAGDGTLFGAYQLEIRTAEAFGISQHPTLANPGSFVVTETYDTNDRLAQQTAILAPAGASVADGDTFTMSDGVQSVVFEFDTGDGVATGNVAIPFQAADTSDVIAERIRDAINSAPVQQQLKLTAGMADGTNEGPNVGHGKQINLYGNAIVDDGIEKIEFNLDGDSNRFRDQGQLLIHSNFITDSRDFGIVTDAGARDAEPRVDEPFLGSHPGAVRNLRELNNVPDGGFVTGPTIENNVITGEGLGGIHVSGNEAPFEIMPFTDTPNNLSGEFVCDGGTITIHSNRTTVTFEFEDISGGSAPCGSAHQGGDGWREGNIPIFYRQSAGGWLYPPRSIPPHPYTQMEMATAIRDAIQSSILVTNGTTLHSSATLTESRWGRSALTNLPLISVYVDNVTSVETRVVNDRQVPLGPAAQPYSRVVNNTIFGNDGTRASFPGSGLDESNDTMVEAVETQQGRQHHPLVFTDTASIGDGIDTPSDASLDIDFYRFQLNVGERVTVDIDTLGLSQLDSMIRLFDAAGHEVARSDNDPAPGELPSTESYLDFTAAEAGSYYVAVSGAGNDQYDPQSLGNRIGPVSDGAYQIEVSVMAPRSWVITAIDGTQMPDGTTFTVSDINNSVTYEFDDVNLPGVAAGNIAIPYDSSPLLNNNRGPGYRPPEMAVVIANAIGQGLNGVDATALGGVAGATPALPTAPSIDGDTSWWGIVGLGHDTPLTSVQATMELYVVVTGASNITGDPVFEQMLRPRPDENIDQLLPETGILVSERATPTLLNNVLANLDAGIWQDASPTTVVGASIFQHNAVTDSNVGAANDDFNIRLGDDEPLFVNAANDDFYPAPMARSIDSALDSLEERTQFETVMDAVGISVSPILAPELDAVGLLRSDDPDVDTPAGLGANVFKDRGGLDRADFVGPDAILVQPRDNDAEGIDKDPTETVVQLPQGLYDHFAIQLVDGLQATESGEGVGIDDLTVDSSKVAIAADGVLLVEGVDYTFGYNPTTNTIRLTPLSGLWDENRAYVITLPNRDRFVIKMPNGGEVADGDTFFVTDEFGGTVTFEFESGFSLAVPETLTLQVPVEGVGGGGIQDGQRFIVNFGVGQALTFEYDANSPPNYLPGDQPIDISAATTIDDVAQATIAALNAANIAITARDLGGGRIHVGAPANYSVNTTLTNLTQSGQTGVVSDGQRISISDGVQAPVTFEFDSNGFVTPGNVAIAISDSQTSSEIAQVIAAAIANGNVGMDGAASFADAQIHLGGTVNHLVDASNAPRLILSGQPGVRSSTRLFVPSQGAGGGGIADGQTFVIANGSGVSDTFEFDYDGQTLPGHRSILFSAANTVAELAQSIIASIKLAPIGNDPAYPLNPAYVGGGEIILNDTIYHLTDVSATALTKSGVPGGVVEIDYTPNVSFTAEQFAPLILDAVRNSQVTGVTTTFRGGATYFLDGIRAVSGLTNFFVGAIRDQARNTLLPNQANNETQFTILMPGVVLDYGDAPATYPTWFVDDGARHVVTEDPIFLGSGVNAEADGQPSTAANADTDDGVIFDSPFSAHVETQVSVTASAAGVLDAWIDYNQDGDWNDPGEQVFSSEPLVAGVNTLTLQTSLAAVEGTTFARFRFSTSGGLHPGGLAVGGEVEDYAVQVLPGWPPVANDDSALSTDEDTAIVIDGSVATGLLANDSDADGDSITLRNVDNTSSWGATVTIDSSGNVVYDPTGSAALNALPLGASLEDTFTYQIEDAVGLQSNRATVTVHVDGRNDDPVGVADQYVSDEDTILNIAAAGVRTNDFDPDNGDAITVVAADAESANHAAVVVNADGSFTYDPTSAADVQATRPGEILIDTFTYTIEDNSGRQGQATVTIQVAGINDVPVAVADDYATAADTKLDVAAPGLLDNDIDADHDTVLFVSSADSISQLGVPVTVNADGGFSYDPTGVEQFRALPAGQQLSDTFQYTVVDEYGATDSATATITVIGTNDAPVAVDDQYATDHNRILNVPAPGVLGNDSDVDTGDTLVVSRADATSLAGAIVTVNADGSFSFDPTISIVLGRLKPGEETSDSFTYDVSDGHGGTDTATVTVVVTGVNNPPDAVNDDYFTDEDSVFSVPAVDGVLTNDMDPDGQSISVVDFDGTSSAGATVSVNADGSFTYDPTGVVAIQGLNVGEQLTDTFTYTIADNYTVPRTDTATVTVRIEGINDAPVAVDDFTDAPRDGSVVVDVLVNDDDVDGTLQVGSVTVVDQPAHGTAAAQADGTILYTPAASYSGADSFTYTVEDDSQAVSNVATVNVNANAAPVAINDDVETFGGVRTTIHVLSNDYDIDGTIIASSVVVVDLPTHGAVDVRSDGSVMYTPLGGFIGHDSFTYTVADDDGARSNEAEVSIGVIVDPLPWQNPENFLDVNADGTISPIDALLIINDLNFNGSRMLPNPPIPPMVPPPYLDANGDNQVAPIDALLVINFLNGVGNGEGELVASGNVVQPEAYFGVGALIAGPAPSVGFDQLARVDSGSPAAIVDSSTRAVDDYVVTIGTAADTTPFADDLLHDIAEDVHRTHDDQLLEDLAIAELLSGKDQS